MSTKYDKNNVPYDGDVKKAIKAKDYKAIKIIRKYLKNNPESNGETKTNSKTKRKVKTKPTCMVCLDKFNSGNRKRVDCPNCEKGCCVGCLRKCLLASSLSTPECPGCAHKFSLEFVADNTPKIFHNNQYRKKRAQDLLSQQRSLLPVTQQFIVDKAEQDRRANEINMLHEESHNIRIRLKEIRAEVTLLESRTYGQKEKKERNTFVMGCGVSDCRGFLSQAWKCGTCGVNTCSKCRVVKVDGEEHECDDDDVATANLLTKETKPCPKCTVTIYKISGCDQMWCTECNTPFSWKTGKIVTGVIHNPHFYEWQRSQNGGVAPRPEGERYNCGGIPWIQTVEQIMIHRGTFFPNWAECHRSVNHISRVVARRYPRQVGIQDHTDLRIKYLLKDINEKEWGDVLRRRQKKVEKDQEIHNILEMYSVTLTDIFQRFVRGDLDIQRQSNVLREYVNDNLQKISVRYNNLVPQINEDWQEARWR